MRYTREQIQEYITRLKQAIAQAMDRNQFTRAVTLGESARILSEWLEQGMPGEIPVDIRALLGEEKSALQEAVEQAHLVEREKAGDISARREAWKKVLAIDPQHSEALEALRMIEAASPESIGSPEPELVELFKEAWKKREEGKYLEARTFLEGVVRDTKSEALRQEAREKLKQVEEELRTKMAEALEKARRVEKEQPGDLPARREAWVKVLALDPQHIEALEALRRLEQEENLRDVRRKIESLKEPLRGLRKDIRVVEEAIKEASKLLYEPLPDPELKKTLDEVYNQLNALRNDILRASEGGASQERAKNFESAIAKYAAALRQGYDVIADDVTGEPIDVREALRRTRLAYWQDLINRAEWRIAEAEGHLKEGYPEAAVSRLQEAQALIKLVEEGGEDCRRKIDQILPQAQEALQNWQKAQQLVIEAERILSPQEALEKLYEARQIFPSYPGLNKIIADKESRAATQTARDIATDLSYARGAVAARDFGKAREYCQQAKKRGATLGLETDELREARRAIEELLQKIDASEARWKRLEQIEQALDKKDSEKAEHLLLQWLDERPEEASSSEIRRYQRQLAFLKIDRAFEANDRRLVKHLLDQLSAEDKETPGAKERQARLALFEADDKRYAQAERFFLEGIYEQAIELCESLKDSPIFAKQAMVLQHRAEARLWLEQAQEAYRKGDLDEARKKYEAVERVLRQLPEEDSALVQEAKAGRAQVEQDQKRVKEWYVKLEKAKSLRKGLRVRWEEWYRAMQDLRENAPECFWHSVEVEYEEGAKEWKERALEEAQDFISKGEATQAYKALKPLVDAELLSAEEALWREVQCQHSLDEAQKLLDSPQPEDWEKAESLAEEAKRIAPKTKLQEATECFWRILCQATARYADFLAASANPGPEGAIEFLETKMKKHQELMMLPDLRSRFIRYCLDLGDYAKALDQAQTIGYIPGEAAVAIPWKQTVAAAQDFASGRWEQAVNALLDVQHHALVSGESHSTLKEVHRHVVQGVLDQLRQKVGAAPLALSDEELISRIQVLDLILRLDPQNTAAKEESRKLADRLAGLIRPLRDQADGVTLKDSLQRSLEEGERVLSKIQSTIRTWEVTGRKSSDIAPLKTSEKDLQDKLRPWRQAWMALQQLQEQWDRSVSGAWNIAELKKYLEEARTALREGEVQEIAVWDRQVKDLETGIGELEDLIAQAERAWREENFEVFIRTMDNMQERASAIRTKLGEERFLIPDKKLSFYDTQAQARVVGIGDLRKRAQEKWDNLKQWETWTQSFEAEYNQARSLWAQIDGWTKATPPCLSRPLQEISLLEQKLQALREKLKLRPTEVLSDKAKELSEKIPLDQLEQALIQSFKQVEQKRDWLEEQIQSVVDPLKSIEEFMRTRRPLSNPRNRNTLAQLLDELRAVDSCHPELEKYESLLKRYER